jgi:hypothetical protein
LRYLLRTLLHRRFLLASLSLTLLISVLILSDEMTAWTLAIVLPMLMSSLCAWRGALEDFYVYLRG